ncbi:hypothetical protein DAPPUDRAFT_324742 [Daphnia pulex]|uniref:Uncharacterized protein n=1 Tax=Daphnia pulex TaxID=6669 RepID=E9H2L0_DAPPU|nr:hypothetical protein DAPPUDRAFT_324742 [Daphnia pulex]|eukprot:EFX73992.1 hypothetical protein DAPPUDRAFT_324742 [Daphnia pulex]
MLKSDAKNRKAPNQFGEWQYEEMPDNKSKKGDVLLVEEEFIPVLSTEIKLLHLLSQPKILFPIKLKDIGCQLSSKRIRMNSSPHNRDQAASSPQSTQDTLSNQYSSTSAPTKDQAGLSSQSAQDESLTHQSGSSSQSTQDESLTRQAHPQQYSSTSAPIKDQAASST